MHVSHWTGSKATALQAAMRMTNERFAAKIGCAVRTVSSWHAKPETAPRADIQQALDTMLEQAAPTAKALFRTHLERYTAAEHADDAEALRVAVAIVQHERNVLLVCRRVDQVDAPLLWQFPSGIVKPRASSAAIAIQETLAETGVRCSVRDQLGSRLHPMTHVHCDYFLCDYLAGEPVNRDPVENTDVTWAPFDRLTNFIPVENLYPPILDALEGTNA